MNILIEIDLSWEYRLYLNLWQISNSLKFFLAFASRIWNSLCFLVFCILSHYKKVCKMHFTIFFSCKALMRSFFINLCFIGFLCFKRIVSMIFIKLFNYGNSLQSYIFVIFVHYFIELGKWIF